MKKWLLWLQMYFTLAIVDDTQAGGGDDADTLEGDVGDDTVDGGDGDDTVDGDGGDDTLDAGGGDDDPAPQPRSRANNAIRQLREEKQAAEERARRAEEAYRAAQPKPASEDDRIREAEDAKLRDPKTTPLEKWQIDSNRTIRETKRASNQALAQAQDLSDKTSFDLACASKPRLRAVKDEVEKRLQAVRATGQNVQREALARYIIGERVLNAPAKKAAPAIDRGKTPGARSDVNSRGSKTERDKRNERLRGVAI